MTNFAACIFVTTLITLGSWRGSMFVMMWVNFHLVAGSSVLKVKDTVKDLVAQVRSLQLPQCLRIHALVGSHHRHYQHECHHHQVTPSFVCIKLLPKNTGQPGPGWSFFNFCLKICSALESASTSAPTLFTAFSQSREVEASAMLSINKSWLNIYIYIFTIAEKRVLHVMEHVAPAVMNGELAKMNILNLWSEWAPEKLLLRRILNHACPVAARHLTITHFHLLFQGNLPEIQFR